MTTYPTVSVVVPAFNCAAYISRAINSVLVQGHHYIEILVVNDGSTDDTANVLSRYGDRVRVVHQENQGVAAARNRAIELSSADWIAFLDSDDVWHARKLELQLLALDTCPEVDLVFSGFRMVDSLDRCLVHDAIRSYYGVFARRQINWGDVFNSGRSVVGGTDLYFGDCYPTLFQGNFIKTSTVMVRRQSLVSTGLFRSDLRTEEDYDLWLRVCSAGSVAFLDSSLVDARRRPDQLTSPENAGVVADNVAKVISLAAADAVRKLGEPAVEQRLAGIYRHLAGIRLLAGEHRCARQAAMKSMKHGSVKLLLIGIVAWSFLPGALTRAIRNGVRAYRNATVTTDASV